MSLCLQWSWELWTFSLHLWKLPVFSSLSQSTPAQFLGLRLSQDLGFCCEQQSCLLQCCSQSPSWCVLHCLEWILLPLNFKSGVVLSPESQNDLGRLNRPGCLLWIPPFRITALSWTDSLSDFFFSENEPRKQCLTHLWPHMLISGLGFLTGQPWTQLRNGCLISHNCNSFSLAWFDFSNCISLPQTSAWCRASGSRSEALFFSSLYKLSLSFLSERSSLPLTTNGTSTVPSGLLGVTTGSITAASGSTVGLVFSTGVSFLEMRLRFLSAGTEIDELPNLSNFSLWGILSSV